MRSDKNMPDNRTTLQVSELMPCPAVKELATPSRLETSPATRKANSGAKIGIVTSTFDAKGCSKRMLHAGWSLNEGDRP
jgi:hypothetical protein